MVPRYRLEVWLAGANGCRAPLQEVFEIMTERSPTLRTVFLLASALEVKPSRLVAEAENSVGKMPKADIR